MAALTCVKVIDFRLPPALPARERWGRKNMSVEGRRAAFEAARDKALRLGLKFEDDAGFLTSVGEWINSEISIKELRLRYMNLLYHRQDARWLGISGSGNGLQAGGHEQAADVKSDPSELEILTDDRQG